MSESEIHPTQASSLQLSTSTRDQWPGKSEKLLQTVAGRPYCDPEIYVSTSEKHQKGCQSISHGPLGVDLGLKFQSICGGQIAKYNSPQGCSSRPNIPHRTTHRLLPSSWRVLSAHDNNDSRTWPNPGPSTTVWWFQIPRSHTKYCMHGNVTQIGAPLTATQPKRHEQAWNKNSSQLFGHKIWFAWKTKHSSGKSSVLAVHAVWLPGSRRYDLLWERIPVLTTGGDFCKGFWCVPLFGPGLRTLGGHVHSAAVNGWGGVSF